MFTIGNFKWRIRKIIVPYAGIIFALEFLAVNGIWMPVVFSSNFNRMYSFIRVIQIKISRIEESILLDPEMLLNSWEITC